MGNEDANELIYSIKTKKTVLFLEALLNELCGNAHISFEGDLSKVTFDRISGKSEIETSVLKRSTTYPGVDFIVLPIEESTKDEIIEILHRIGVRRRIVHVQIEKDGKWAFGAYDKFDFADASMLVSENTLKNLLRMGIIKSYKIEIIESE